MEQIYILKYKNYANRRIDRPFSYVSSYTNYIVYRESKCNFNEGDKITTTFVAGRQNNAYNGDGNYLLVADYDDPGLILNRWFILKQQKTRGGQWQLTLKRDTISDYYKEFLSTVANIKRGYVDVSNKLIYNNENFNLNQIKKDEIALKDKTGCSWIVGYYTEQSSGTDSFPLTITVTNSNIPTITYSNTLDDFKSKYSEFTEKVVLSKYVDDTNLEYNENMDYTFSYIKAKTAVATSFLKVTDKINLVSDLVNRTEKATEITTYTTGYAKEYIDYTKLDKATMVSYTNELMSSSMDRNNLNYYNNKYVKFSDGTIKFIKYNYAYKAYDRTLTTDNSLYNYFNTNLISSFVGTPDWTINIAWHQGVYTLEVLDTALGTYNVTIDSSKAQLVDAPYKMFCIPYGDVPITVGTKTLTLNKDIALLVAQALNTKYGETFIKDLQLLPYCPCQTYIQADGSLIVPNLITNYSEIKNNDTTIGYILHCYESSFDFSIFKEITVNDVKLENETDLYRLSSPNGNGAFDFNLAKNGGLDFINVYCTYMPFNPFIHLCPNFKNLYGAKNFNDYRGLICGGDFSLPKVTSAWETYQLNNKNYQAIFDRGVTNLEINQQVDRTNEIASIFTGALTSVTTGATSGLFLSGGNPLVAGISAGVGAAASVGTGIADYAQNEKLRKETTAYQKDIFTLQNGNIKAQAQGIAKTIAFNANNKIFPLLEYYTCSDNEKEQVKQYFKYKAYTLNTIDTIKNYVNYDGDYNYIEGIIVETTISDPIVTNDINNELYGGIYINGTI